MNDPCEQCDFIGPLLPVTQQSTDLHRAWHDLARVWKAGMAELRKAFTSIADAAATATKANYALVSPTDEETMITTPPVSPEAWRVEPGDDVLLTRKLATIGGRVTRIDLSATKGTGIYVYGHHLPHWVGPRHDTWTLAEHHPAIPPVLHAGALYDVETSDGRTLRAHWSPIDGIRANHPWLHPDGETRYRRDLIIRARLADTERNQP